MKNAFGERFVQWGVQVERLELLDMTPKAGDSHGVWLGLWPKLTFAGDKEQLSAML